ncbi:undecaprenyl-diphosphate phosphatase [Candidatus Microgenomates bacterium]|nr:undecaprenyl-diphosphate phosphatase [Candidatus Microgenomates bacterium]
MIVNIISSIILGIIQGITEFLPVSSSGHLVIAQTLIPGFRQPGVLFDVVLHLGTTLAVIIFYYKRIIEILKSNWNYIWLLVIGTIPAGLAGVLFSKQLEAMFSDVKAIAIQFLITGVICILIDRYNGIKDKITTKNSFLIGVAQAIAIIPAISRSGLTIFTGSVLGIDKKKVAEFSFLMSIPAILGANALEFVKHGVNMEGEIANYIVGFIAAFIFGYLSIKVVLSTLHEKQFKYFGVYCLILAIVTFIFVG